MSVPNGSQLRRVTVACLIGVSVGIVVWAVAQRAAQRTNEKSPGTLLQSHQDGEPAGASSVPAGRTPTDHVPSSTRVAPPALSDDHTGPAIVQVQPADTAEVDRVRLILATAEVLEAAALGITDRAIPVGVDELLIEAGLDTGESAVAALAAAASTAATSGQAHYDAVYSPALERVMINALVELSPSDNARVFELICEALRSYTDEALCVAVARKLFSLSGQPTLLSNGQLRQLAHSIGDGRNCVEFNAVANTDLQFAFLTAKRDLAVLRTVLGLANVSSVASDMVYRFALLPAHAAGIVDAADAEMDPNALPALEVLYIDLAAPTQWSFDSSEVHAMRMVRPAIEAAMRRLGGSIPDVYEIVARAIASNDMMKIAASQKAFAQWVSAGAASFVHGVDAGERILGLMTEEQARFAGGPYGSSLGGAWFKRPDADRRDAMELLEYLVERHREAREAWRIIYYAAAISNTAGYARAEHGRAFDLVAALLLDDYPGRLPEKARTYRYATRSEWAKCLTFALVQLDYIRALAQIVVLVAHQSGATDVLSAMISVCSMPLRPEHIASSRQWVTEIVGYADAARYTSEAWFAIFDLAVQSRAVGIAPVVEALLPRVEESRTRATIESGLENLRVSQSE